MTPEKKGNGKASVYVVMKGYCMDDKDQQRCRNATRKVLREFGVRRIVDADAGLLPEGADMGAREDVEHPEPILDDHENGIIPIFEPRRNYEPPRNDGGRNDGGWSTVNVFLKGKVALDKGLDPVALDERMRGLAMRWDVAHVTLIIKSPMHRTLHRDHTCIPSFVLAQHQNVVLVEQSILKELPFRIEVNANGQDGMLEKVVPLPQGFVPTEAWVESPEMQSIPDGTGTGVGGRSLMEAMALERSGYHRGGSVPKAVLAQNPRDLGLIEETSPDSLPQRILAKEVRVHSVTGSGGGAPYLLHVDIENTSGKPLDVDIPAGAMFETIDPKAGVQNLAVGGGKRITLGAGERRVERVTAHCANHGFASPHDTPMRPTIFKMESPRVSQDGTWDHFDNRGRGQ